MKTLQIKNNRAPWDGVGGIERGSMTYIPYYGSQRIFLVMGAIFDAAKQLWYNQTTTGTAPSARIKHCAAGINSTNTTCEIFVYGGWGGFPGESTIQFDTIHILSLPAFHWINGPYKARNPRHAHTCHAVGGNQILSVGGLDSNAKLTNADRTALLESNFNSSADPFSQGLGVFDMSKLAWSDQYKAGQTTYEQSDPIKAFYAQNGSSYRTNLDLAVLDLMNSANFDNPAGSTTAPSSPPSNAPSPSSNKSTKTGAIAGSTIGAIVAIAIVASLIFLLSRRKRRRRVAAHADSASADPLKWPPDTYEAAGEGLVELNGRERVHEMEQNGVGRHEVGWKGPVEMG